jgi:phage tail tape-measure protein
MKELKVSGGALWAGILTGAITQITDTIALMKGRMKKGEYAVESAGNISSALGVIAGIEYGATLGTTIFPGVGTAIGSVVGGLMGDRLGRFVGHKTGQIFYKSQVVEVNGKNVTVNNRIDDCEKTTKDF